MLACSTFVRENTHNKQNIMEALAKRDAHRERHEHITGNIFDEDMRQQLRGKSNVAITSFVRYLEDATYSFEDWRTVIGNSLVEDGLWFDIDQSTYDHYERNYRVNVFEKKKSGMEYLGEFCRYGYDQETILPGTLNRQFT